MINRLRDFYFVGPQCLLEQRSKDGGESMRQLVRSTLELWKLDNLDITPDGKVMARLTGGLFGLSPLSPQDKEISEIEPWQVSKDPLISNNLTLFHDLWRQNSPSLEQLRKACDPTDIWAAALLEFGTYRSSIEMATYDLLLVSFVQSYLSESHIKDSRNSALKAIALELQAKVSKLGRNPVANAAALKGLTTKAREQNSKLTANGAANMFAGKPEIGGIQRTRILEYYEIWFPDWPKGKGGRPKKTIHKS